MNHKYKLNMFAILNQIPLRKILFIQLIKSIHALSLWKNFSSTKSNRTRALVNVIKIKSNTAFTDVLAKTSTWDLIQYIIA